MRTEICHINTIYTGLIPEKCFFSRKKSLFMPLCYMQQVHLKQIYLMVEYKAVNKGKCKQRVEVMVLISN